VFVGGGGLVGGGLVGGGLVGGGLVGGGLVAVGFGGGFVGFGGGFVGFGGGFVGFGGGLVGFWWRRVAVGCGGLPGFRVRVGVGVINTPGTVAVKVAVGVKVPVGVGVLANTVLVTTTVWKIVLSSGVAAARVDRASMVAAAEVNCSESTTWVIGLLPEADSPIRLE
jgi:hypothetical protein